MPRARHTVSIAPRCHCPRRAYLSGRRYSVRVRLRVQPQHVVRVHARRQADRPDVVHAAQQKQACASHAALINVASIL